MESGINRVSVAKTIRIPPKHNGVISVSIKGHDIKTPTACFIGSQYMDTEVRLIDGVHDISCNTTLQVLVINNSNQHVNFPKGMKIGHLEPPIDDLAQIPINSATTQWMLPKTVKPDSFTPPKYQLNSTTQQQLDNLLGTFKDQFVKDETTIGTTPLTQMSIDMGDSEPVLQKPYPVAMKHYNWAKEEIDKLLEAGVIRNSHSSWSAPIIVVPKGDGGKHLVIDYIALNKVTRKFMWPMPKVEDIFSQLNSAKYFSTLDLRARYHHIGLTTDSIPKTVFTSPFGKYEYIKVPFGLAQAPAYFQELMTGVLKDLPFAMAYLDDIIIYSSTPEEHLEHIKTVFEKLHHAKLSMKLSKCHFFTKEIQHLGHILDVEGIKPVPTKTEAIKAMHPPMNLKQVCAFLGLVRYYRKFIKNSETTNNVNSNGCKVQMEGNTPQRFHETEGSHHPSTHSAIPRHNKFLHCVHRCLQQCLRSSALTDTQWNRIPSSFLIAYIYRHPKEMEYTRTRSILYLLRHQEMELLPTRGRHHSKK